MSLSRPLSGAVLRPPTRLRLGHRGHQQHVGAVLVAAEVEVVVHPLREHRRREGPERLAELDLQVHHRLHLRGCGRRRGCCGCPAPAGRTPCAPAASRPPSRWPISSATCSHRASSSSKRRYVAPLASRNARISLVREARARGAMPRWPSREPRHALVAQQLVPDEQRRAERAAGVAGGRLDPDVLERPLAQDAAVADAVQRHAAGQAQVLRCRSARARAGRPGA